MTYDAFFIGGGNLPALYGRLDTSDQLLIPVNTSKKSSIVLPKNDFVDFSGEKVQISSDNYKKIFMEFKKKAYDLFNFLFIKSQNIPYPLTEEELLLNDTDHALIEGLSGIVTDYTSVASLATLYGYSDMGIHEVAFKEIDGCPLCKAFDGSIKTIEEVVNLLARNEFLVHPHCECEFKPIIRREAYKGLLSDDLEIDTVQIDDLFLMSVPVELEEEIVTVLAEYPPKFTKIEFLDLLDYFRDNNLSYSGQVCYKEEDILYVHNSYLFNLGPVDFLRSILEENTNKELVNPADLSGTVLYFQGEQVVERAGSYWSIDTGKKVY